MLRIEGGSIVSRQRFGRTELVDPSTGKMSIVQSLEGLRTFETEKPLTRFPNFSDRPRDFLAKQREEREREIERIIKEGRKQKKLEKSPRSGEREIKEPRVKKAASSRKINNSLAQAEARLEIEKKLALLPPAVAMVLRKQMGIK